MHRIQLSLVKFAVAALLLLAATGALALDAEALLQEFNDYPHAQLVDSSTREVIGHEVGLGALQKHLDDWQFKRSERLSGTLLSYSWQIVDGFTSAEVLAELESRLASDGDNELLFSCEGRSCGHGAQWANRVFGQRVLYGRADMQRYRVYRLNGEREARLVLYASARTADRQYLHAELLTVASG